jgi:hypothetical protein
MIIFNILFYLIFPSLFIKSDNYKDILIISPESRKTICSDINIREDVDINGDNNLERIRIIESIPIDIINKNKFPDGYWEGDFFRLTIEDFTKPLIYSEEFYSAYGKFKIYILNLTGTSNLDFIFELQKGHGTNATTHYYVIKHWNGKELEEKATIKGGYWYIHNGKGPLLEYSGTPVYCEREINLEKISYNQYEASFPLSPNCYEIIKYLIPRSKEEADFIKKKNVKLIYIKEKQLYKITGEDEIFKK